MASLLPTGADANGASSGNATTTTTGAGAFSGTAANVQHSSTQKIEGIAAFYLSGTTSAYLRFDPALHTSSLTSFYVYVDVNTGTSFAMLVWRDDANTVDKCDFRILSTGDFQLRNSSLSSVWTYAYTLDTWYRVDWEVNVGSNQQRVRVYTGANLHSSVTANAISDSGLVGYGGGAHRYLRFGTVSAPSGTPGVYVDYLRSDDTTIPAPYSPPPAGDSTIYMNNAGFPMRFAQDTVNVVEATALRPTTAVMRLKSAINFDPVNVPVGTPTVRWKTRSGTGWVDLKWVTWTGAFWAPMIFQDRTGSPSPQWEDMQ